MLGACGRTEPQSSAVQVGVTTRVRGITPKYSLEFGEGQVSGMVFESLAERDSVGNAVPWLAKRWASPDSQQWTFTLQGRVTFHDGTRLRADDVVRSWTALVADSTDGDEPPGAFMLVRGADAVRTHAATAIEGLRVIDDTTLQVVLIRRDPGFPRTLGSRRLGVTGAVSTRWSPVGTGPWRFVAATRHDSVLRFARFDRYWNARAASESLVVRVVNSTQLAQAFAAGQLDCASDLVHGQALPLSISRGLRIEGSAPLTRLRILLNFGNPALRDARVRRALLLALDRQTLLRTAGLKNAVISDEVVPPSLLPPSAVPPTAYNPDSARALLTAAGFTPSRPLRVRTVFIPQGEGAGGMERVLAWYWQAIGVRIEASGGRTDEASNHRPPADVEVYTEEPGVKTPEEYLSLVAVEGPYGRVVATPKWESDAFRSHYATARSTRDPTVREGALRAMRQMMSDSLPTLPLFYFGANTARSLRMSSCDEAMPRYGQSRVTP